MNDDRETMRIAQFLARCGVASRRKSEEIVRAGRVQLNGETITDLGRQIDPAADRVTVEGKPVGLAKANLTLAYHKPPRVLTTRHDPQGRRTVYQELPPAYRPRSSELVYAGRLDFMTSGLLILSTDGALINALTHPRFHVEKAYEAGLDRALKDREVESLRGGVDLDDGRTLPAQVTRLAGPRPVYEIVIHEGRNRQVRRMIEAVGARTTFLRRTRIGFLSLDALGLEVGDWIPLEPSQIAMLQDGTI